MSVWESVEALAAFVYSDAHRQVLRLRRQWFERMAEAYVALWWIPRGHIPTTDEAEERVLRLRASGPTPYAFTLREHFPPPGVSRLRADPQPGRVDLPRLIPGAIGRPCAAGLTAAGPGVRNI